MRFLIATATVAALIVSTIFTAAPAAAKHKRHKAETVQYMRAVPSGQPVQR
jgi:hypothetical protein